MKEIRLCDDASLNRVYELCVNKGLGVEVQDFYNPNLIDTVESDKLLAEYKKALENFQGGKSLHAPFWDLNLGSKNPLVKEATMKAFNYSYKIAKAFNKYIPAFTEHFKNIGTVFENVEFITPDNARFQ